MENSKMPGKYYLYVNFFAKKKTVFLITKKFKTRTFSMAENKNFSVIS